MSKVIVLIDEDQLEHVLYVNSKARAEFQGTPYDPNSAITTINLGDMLKEYATLQASLNREGKWNIEEFIKGPSNTQNPLLSLADQNIDLISVFYKIAAATGLILEDPGGHHPICVCPIECDCSDPDNGLKSMSCPIHNDEPDPDPECPQHGCKAMN